MSKYSSLTAQRLREAMDNKNIKASELVEKSGVSKSNISGYINGKFTPTNINAIKIANVLGVQPEWLMGLMPSDIIDSDTNYIGEISKGNHPIVWDLLKTTQNMDTYFLERLLEYAKKLQTMQNELED